MVTRRQSLRGLFALLVLLATGVLVVGYVDAQRTSDAVTGDPAVEQAFRSGNTSPVVGERDDVTVVGTDSNAFVSDDNDAPRAMAELAAFAPDGSIYYYENRHTRYWDVDPVKGTKNTVEFVYADHLDRESCNGDGPCTENGVVRVNLTTGNRTTVYSRITPGKHSTRWHDVDRIDEHRLLVADISQDRVYVVNTTTDLVTWEWDAQSDFDVESGGPYPEDWTHLNDVEYVEVDGEAAVMADLRNQDQVVFISFEDGLMEDWTLGADGNHSTLYEQHNPDFIPEEEGGPAILVADSENGRVVEYQREDGKWKRSWTWSDARMTWPRDADRLPNGNTLITDSHGDRVFEVNPEGEVVWTASIGFPYEAERLGTGDESAGGPSAASADLANHTATAGGGSGGGSLLPQSLRNAIAYVFPRWVETPHAIAAVLVGLVVPAWVVLEYHWASFSLGLRLPVTFRRDS
ncbi:arylsulfotransferase (asst) [Halorubellus litoreus]|uniref:Arylsulfotransferase (Asst) n=1 Tax=Halorubellus litoreus TaxID=755308 RepID=A0ABD5VH20_9EURY